MMELTHFLHGGDYNPEQWLEYPEILKKDIEYMKEAKINAVSMGIFSWAALEPEEGRYTFDWMEQIIENLYENGISVILATPSGSKPKWMTDQYPEILRVDETRHRNLYGFRHNHCYTSPKYREKVAQINTELVRRFGNHPAVILWHISNEIGGECHCPLCQQAFREWLSRRYQTIEELNKKWCTCFWSHSYQSFDQIESPSPRGEMALQALTLDWKRFVTDQTLDYIRHEIRTLREAGSTLPVTTNMMYHYDGLNYHKFADDLDVISWDTYPTWHKGPEKLTAMDNGMQHDIMRSLKREPYLMMESCPSGTNWQSVSKLKKPGLLEAASMQAVAHGSDSVLYFQIRQSRGSFEKFHGAVIDHYGGNDTRVFKEVKQTGEDLMAIRELIGSQVHADVAVLYDWENRWALEGSTGPRNKGLYYKEAVEKSYYAFRKLGLNVDLIDMEQSVSDYKIVVAPMLYMFRDGFEEKMRAFVKSGGTFIMTYWSGIVDENDRCSLGGTPYGLMDVMGLRSTEIDGLYDGEENTFIPANRNIFISKNIYICKHLCELVDVDSAEVLMTYGGDFYEGTPAVTCNQFGEGRAYYVGADVEQSCYDDLYRHAVSEQGIRRPEVKGISDSGNAQRPEGKDTSASGNAGNLAAIPDGVEVTTRVSETAEYVIVQNFSRSEVKVELPEGEFLMGNDGNIPAFGTVIVKRGR